MTEELDVRDLVSHDYAESDCGQKHAPRKVVTRPFDKDISAGKNTYVYDAHTYHTKVPPQGIAQLIEHYTSPGEMVVDPFCGSGMTGVAALELGRRAVLSDLSPAAAFIAKNLCTPVDHVEFMAAVDSVIAECSDLQEHLYTTACRDCGKSVAMLYTVWSYDLHCNECGEAFCLWDVARDERPSVRESKIKSEFDCPHCEARIAKRGLKRSNRHPVQVGYRCCAKGMKEQTAAPDKRDLKLLRGLSADSIPAHLWYPTNKFPVGGVNTRQPIAAGIDSVEKAYTPRALWAMARLWKAACDYPDLQMGEKLKFALTSLYQRVTLFSEFRFWGGSGNTANYNVPHIANEQNVFVAFRRKAATISWYFRDAPKLKRDLYVGVHSATSLEHIEDGAAHYVFTDPPFGSNINYSEMNFLWESWLGNHTDITEEAIVSKPQNKSIDDYRVLLCRSFLEASRVLRQDGWMTVVFHNSSEKVWSALQQAITDAGFVVKGTQTFDKKHGTFKMHVSDNAVGYDLVLHCQKATTKRRAPLKRTTVTSCRTFIAGRLNSGYDYRVKFLHVKRKSEFDYRRLYAEWLCSSFAKAEISLDFESFRLLVDEVRGTNAKGRVA